MAEVIASPLIKAVIQKLANEAVKQVGRVQGIRSELKSLEKTLPRIQALLVDASDKEIKEVPVQEWLNDLKHLAYDIDDILDDLATDAMNPEFVKNSGASTSKSLTWLTTLEISYCKSKAWSSFPDLQLPSLTSLTDLVIMNCPSMDVPTAGLWPPNLRRLYIGLLKKPISEWGPQKFPSTLVDLTLIGKEEAATNWSQLSHLHLPSSLTRLCIQRFDNLATVSEGLQHLASLQHLEIEFCPKIKDLPETLLPSLLSLEIYRCPELKERCSRGGSYWTQISHIPCIIS